jgi:hypothetical protein
VQAAMMRPAKPQIGQKIIRGRVQVPEREKQHILGSPEFFLPQEQKPGTWLGVACRTAFHFAPDQGLCCLLHGCFVFFPYFRSYISQNY